METTTDTSIHVDDMLRWGLALLSLGAAGIHFGYSIEHFDEYWAFGAFFTVLAWGQALWAVALVLRPSRLVVAAGLVNTLVIGVWVLSRTVGIPFGPEAGNAEAVGFVNVLCTAFEGLIVIGVATLLTRPELATRMVRPRTAVSGVATAGLAVVALSTAAFTPSAAAGHSHADTDDGHGSEVAAAEADHHADDAAAVAAVADDAEHDADADHHGDAASVAPNFGGVVDADVLPTGAEPGTDASGHGHTGVSPHVFITDRVVRDQLASELTIARDAALRYPTAADAEAAGYYRVAPYVPLIGSHWINLSHVNGEFDPANPEMILYDGNEPESRIVGLSYYVFTNPQTPPEGFAGPNDPWHQHIGLCLAGGVVVGDVDLSAEECEARGGSKSALDSAWMTHAWVVPGWESPWGTFSAEHPDLR